MPKGEVFRAISRLINRFTSSSSYSNYHDYSAYSISFSYYINYSNYIKYYPDYINYSTSYITNCEGKGIKSYTIYYYKRRAYRYDTFKLVTKVYRPNSYSCFNKTDSYLYY